MSREEHINQIAKDLCSKYSICTCIDRNGRCAEPQRHAGIIYDLGYRKVTEAVWVGRDSKYSRSTLQYDDWYCSKCGKFYPERNKDRLGNYCPHCGAQMVTNTLELHTEEVEPVAKWEFWKGWIGNYDYRIEDATCSRCGYVHPTVRRTFGSRETAKEVLDKLKDHCPNCKSKMEVEEC